MSKISHIENLKFENNDKLVLIRTSSDDGKKYHAYIKVDKEQYKKLNSAYEKDSNIDILEMEGLVYVGEGENPSQGTEKYIKNKYNAK